MGQIGAAAVCVITTGVVLCGFLQGLPVFELFIDGAKDGLQATVRLLPTLIGLIAAITMVRASGILDGIAQWLQPLLNRWQVDAELVPLILLRPLSGSGSTAYVTELFARYGGDAAVSKAAAILSSATETTFYAVAVYFGGRGYRTTKYAVPAALCGDAAAVVLTVIAVRIFG